MSIPARRSRVSTVILTRLHAGGKFTTGKIYRFSGGLHGVGVSVVNALSTRLEVWVRRGGREYHMGFEGGDKKTELQAVGPVAKHHTGTTVRFWPDARYFDAPQIAIPRLKHVLRAKAVLCPGLSVRLFDEDSRDEIEWCYEDGLAGYLGEALAGLERVPREPFTGSLEGPHEAVDWAFAWLVEDRCRRRASHA